MRKVEYPKGGPYRVCGRARWRSAQAAVTVVIFIDLRRILRYKRSDIYSGGMIPESISATHVSVACTFSAGMWYNMNEGGLSMISITQQEVRGAV